MQVFYLNSEEPSCLGRVFDSLQIRLEYRLVSDMKKIIFHIAGTGGVPNLPYARRLKNVKGAFYEIRIKYLRGQLIRIYYFVDKINNQMILLNTVIKPDGASNAGKYSGRSKLKIEKDIKISIELAFEIKKNYYFNSKNYVLLTR